MKSAGVVVTKDQWLESTFPQGIGIHSKQRTPLGAVKSGVVMRHVRFFVPTFAGSWQLVAPSMPATADGFVMSLNAPWLTGLREQLTVRCRSHETRAKNALRIYAIHKSMLVASRFPGLLGVV